MDSKSLMIGDWVQNTRGHKGKVIGFRYDTTDKDNEIVIAYNTNSTTWSQSSLIEPIPLTEEILKANGFNGGCYMTLEYYGKQIEICLASSIPMYVRTKGSWEYSLPHPTYVHELQHALRLCGLNELADNFKLKAMEE